MGEITPIGLNKIKSSLKSSSSRVLEADNDTYNEAEISKRLIELQALISRKDISDDDTLFSSNILESNLTVLR